MSDQKDLYLCHTKKVIIMTDQKALTLSWQIGHYHVRLKGASLCHNQRAIKVITMSEQKGHYYIKGKGPLQYQAKRTITMSGQKGHYYFLTTLEN